MSSACAPLQPRCERFGAFSAVFAGDGSSTRSGVRRRGEWTGGVEGKTREWERDVACRLTSSTSVSRSAFAPAKASKGRAKRALRASADWQARATSPVRRFGSCPKAYGRNSLIVTVGATLLAVIVSTLAGYAYSRHAGKALQASAFILIFIRLVPPIVITLPLFPAVNWLRLNDTHIVLVLLYANFFVSLGTIVMRTFIDQIPRELDEAAMMDGATQLQILRRVIFPLAAQGMLAVSVFVIVYAWNEFLFAFIFTTTKAKTAPMVVAEMIGAVEGVEWGVLFAASTLQLLPVLAFVILMQKHLVAGLTAGAVK